MAASIRQLYRMYRQRREGLGDGVAPLQRDKLSEPMTEAEFLRVCESADTNPLVRDWLYCLEHGRDTPAVTGHAA